MLLLPCSQYLASLPIFVWGIILLPRFTHPHTHNWTNNHPPTPTHTHTHTHTHTDTETLTNTWNILQRYLLFGGRVHNIHGYLCDCWVPNTYNCSKYREGCETYWLRAKYRAWNVLLSKKHFTIFPKGLWNISNLSSTWVCTMQYKTWAPLTLLTGKCHLHSK